MMDVLIETLNGEDCSLVVLHEGNISTFKGRGVRTLYNILDDEPRSMPSRSVIRPTMCFKMPALRLPMRSGWITPRSSVFGKRWARRSEKGSGKVRRHMFRPCFPALVRCPLVDF